MIKGVIVEKRRRRKKDYLFSLAPNVIANCEFLGYISFGRWEKDSRLYVHNKMFLAKLENGRKRRKRWRKKRATRSKYYDLIALLINSSVFFRSSFSLISLSFVFYFSFQKFITSFSVWAGLGALSLSFCFLFLWRALFYLLLGIIWQLSDSVSIWRRRWKRQKTDSG